MPQLTDSQSSPAQTSVTLLGVTVLFLFMSYSGLENIETSLQEDHSSGYYSLSLVYFVNAVTAPLALSLQRVLGSQRALLAAVLGYWVYVAANATSSRWVLTFASVCQGFSAAMLWVTQSIYVADAAASHSSFTGLPVAQALSSFCGTFWAFYAANQVLGNALTFAVCSAASSLFPSSQPVTGSSFTAEARVGLIGTFMACMVCATWMAARLPPSHIHQSEVRTLDGQDDVEEGENRERGDGAVLTHHVTCDSSSGGRGNHGGGDSSLLTRGCCALGEDGREDGTSMVLSCCAREEDEREEGSFLNACSCLGVREVALHEDDSSSSCSSGIAEVGSTLRQRVNDKRENDDSDCAATEPLNSTRATRESTLSEPLLQVPMHMLHAPETGYLLSADRDLPANSTYCSPQTAPYEYSSGVRSSHVPNASTYHVADDSSWHLLRNRRFLMLLPLILYSGCETAFLCGDFTHLVVKPALGVAWIGGCMVAFGAAQIITCIATARYSHTPVAIISCLFLGCACQIAVQIYLIVFYPVTNAVLLLLAAALWGIGEAMFNCQIAALIPIVLPEGTDAAFAQWQTWNSAGYSAMFFLMPLLTPQYTLRGMLCFCSLCMCVTSGMFIYFLPLK